MTTVNTCNKYPEALRYALCAVGFFRGRNGKRPRYKRSQRKNTPTVSARAEKIELARLFIQRARRAGFRGSVREAVKAYEHDSE
mgnify:CR=1 FL=1